MGWAGGHLTRFFDRRCENQVRHDWSRSFATGCHHHLDRDSKHDYNFKGVLNEQRLQTARGEKHSTSIIIVSHFNDLKISITND